MHVPVSREFLESIEKNVLSQRPAWRVDAAKVDTDCDSALLMSDHSLFPGNFCLLEFGRIIVLHLVTISVSHGNIYRCASHTSITLSKQVTRILALKPYLIKKSDGYLTSRF